MGLFFSGHEEAKEQAGSSQLQKQLKQLRDQTALKRRTVVFGMFRMERWRKCFTRMVLQCCISLLQPPSLEFFTAQLDKVKAGVTQWWPQSCSRRDVGLGTSRGHF